MQPYAHSSPDLGMQSGWAWLQAGIAFPVAQHVFNVGQAQEQPFPGWGFWVEVWYLWRPQQEAACLQFCLYPISQREIPVACSQSGRLWKSEGQNRNRQVKSSLLCLHSGSMGCYPSYNSPLLITSETHKSLSDSGSQLKSYTGI